MAFSIAPAGPANATRRRWPDSRARHWLAAALICALGLWAASHAGTALIVSKTVEPPDVVVVLASHEFERLPAAIELAQRFPTSTLLLTVPRAPSPWNCHMCPERKLLLESTGIAAGRIVELPWRVGNTYDEAVAIRRFTATVPVGRLVVVTSPYHTRRALRAFEQVLNGTGIEVGVVPATGSSPAIPHRWWLHTYDRRYVPYEWAGLVYYRIKYGVRIW